MITRQNRALMLVADQEDGREAWLKGRRDGLGGSDMAAILGEDPYKGAIDVWLSKVEGMESKVDRERTEVGNLLEPVVLSWYALGAPTWPHREARSVVFRPPTVARRDRAWQRGSVDGLVPAHDRLTRAIPNYYRGTSLAIYGDDAPLVLDLDAMALLEYERGVEVKTHGWWAAKRYQEAEDADGLGVPGDKRIQVAWYQELWEVDTWDLIALVDTHVRKQWTIHRDPQLGADLLAIGEAWWTKHVIGGVPPEPDGSEHYARHLRSRFKASSDRIVMASPAADEAARRLRRWTRHSAKVEREIERLEQRLQSEIGDAAGIDTCVGKMTWKEQRGGIRYKAAVEAAFRDLDLTPKRAEEYLEGFRNEPFRVFRKPQNFK